MTNPKEIIRLIYKKSRSMAKKNYTIIQQIKHHHSNEMVKLISYSMCRLSTPLFNVNNKKSELPGCIAINLAIEFDEMKKN